MGRLPGGHYLTNMLLGSSVGWRGDQGASRLSPRYTFEFRDNRMYVKHIVSHAEYDKLCQRYTQEAD